MAKQVKKVLVGDHAVAEAVKLARVNVISAYPITPQTLIVERISEMIERGELKADYIRVESEFAALATVYGAAAGGARASRQPQAMAYSTCMRCSGGQLHPGFPL